MIVLCVFVLTGCTEHSNYFYSGMENKDIPELSNSQSIEFFNVYKGHTDNWAAVYIIYKTKDTDNYVTKKLLKYIGKKPNPTGKISYDYDAGDDVGSGGVSVTDEPENGIYDLGPSTVMTALGQDYIVKFLIKWEEHSEMIEMKSEKE
ncbi:hypothetical protein [Paenibacillus prosopidis]|uniref:Uncharacterized protein n=1 Tax=Paenibacillus prosopidis TaxID=630520 RepID=A0A368W8I9_9BACL|nr:hypothetical protein [Paenibacillus prosopidis]RCW48959.1 hypothetical protein DFP97_105144 [Paenibacillus prosopidis]